MDDRVRYTSVPPPERGDNLVNPTYSSTNISTASETASVVIFHGTHEPIVDIELAPLSKRILSEPKFIKIALIFLAGLVAILLLLNVTLISVWASSDPKIILDTQETLDRFENKTVISSSTVGPTTTDFPETEIPLTSTTELLTTTLPDPSTTKQSVSDEALKQEYNYFSRRFNRPKSDEGLKNFANNYEFFTSNRARMSVAETQFADMSLNEMKKLVNVNRDSNRDVGRFNCVNVRSTDSSTIAFAMDLHNNSRIPARIDLRRLKTMPKVRNQGTTCNGGYAFAAIGEYDNFSAKSNSVQYLLCDKHNFHCEGGDVFKARQTITNTGTPLENELPFSENQKWCDTEYKMNKSIGPPCFTNGFEYDHSETKKQPVHTVDYISIILSLQATPIVEVPVDRSFFFYKGGFYKPKCDEIIGYQPVIMVGYDKKDGKEFWILRNSFGTDWGIDGDFEMEKGVTYEDANCDAFAYAIY